MFRLIFVLVLGGNLLLLDVGRVWAFPMDNSRRECKMVFSEDYSRTSSIRSRISVGVGEVGQTFVEREVGRQDLSIENRQDQTIDSQMLARILLAVRTKCGADCTEAQLMGYLEAALAQGRGIGSRYDLGWGRSLRYYELTDGEKIMRLEVKGYPQREVPIDAKSGAIETAFSIGEKILEDLFLRSTANQGRDRFLFIDVNNLGLVNYFRAGQLAGNIYLRQIMKIIRHKLRLFHAPPDGEGQQSGEVHRSVQGGRDFIFKLGGDEFAVLLNRVHERDVRMILSRIEYEIASDPLIAGLFHEQRKLLSGQFARHEAAIIRARNLDDLPLEFVSDLTSEMLALARRDFAHFRCLCLRTALDVRGLRAIASVRPGISWGETAIQRGDILNDVVQRSGAAANAMKQRTKEAIRRRLGRLPDKTDVFVDPQLGSCLSTDAAGLSFVDPGSSDSAGL